MDENYRELLMRMRQNRIQKILDLQSGGMTQQQIADLLHVKRQYVNRILCAAGKHAKRGRRVQPAQDAKDAAS